MSRFLLPKPLIVLLLVLLFVVNGCLLQPATSGAMKQEITPLSTEVETAATRAAESNYASTTKSAASESVALGDAFVVQPHDFTYELSQFQQQLAALSADGGGDTPEALNEALHRSIHELNWRTDDTVRMILLVADAQPHLDYADEPFSYDTDMIEAVRRGMKIFTIGASGLEPAGEYIFRQLAQFTGGKFVFLTYADGNNPSSGPAQRPTLKSKTTPSIPWIDWWCAWCARNWRSWYGCRLGRNLPWRLSRHPCPHQPLRPSRSPNRFLAP